MNRTDQDLINIYVSEIIGCNKDKHESEEAAINSLTGQICNCLNQICICCGKDIKNRRGGAKYCFPCYLEIEEEMRRMNKIVRRIAVFHVKRRHQEHNEQLVVHS